MSRACDFLIGIIGVRVAHERQRPAAPNHPFLDILAADLACRERAPISIGAGDVAGPGLVASVPHELVARGDPAGPTLAFFIKTKLIGFRRVDAGEADFRRIDLDGIAIDDARNSADVGGEGRRAGKGEGYERGKLSGVGDM